MNTMKLEFLSRSENERFARMVAAAFVLELDPTMEQLSEPVHCLRQSGESSAL